MVKYGQKSIYISGFESDNVFGDDLEYNEEAPRKDDDDDELESEGKQEQENEELEMDPVKMIMK